MKKSIIYLSTVALLITFSAFAIVEDWFLFKAEDYTLSFPKQPKEETRTMKTQQGDIEVKTATYTAQSNSEQNLKYLSSCNPIPNPNGGEMTETQKEAFFNAAIKGSINNHKGELIFDKKISLVQNPGHHVKMSMNDGQILVTMKVYIAKGKYFGMLVYTPKANDDNTLVDKFLNSFQFKQ